MFEKLHLHTYCTILIKTSQVYNKMNLHTFGIYGPITLLEKHLTFLSYTLKPCLYSYNTLYTIYNPKRVCSNSYV